MHDASRSFGSLSPALNWSLKGASLGIQVSIYRSGALGGAGGGGGVEGSADSWTLPQTVTEMKRERRIYI